MKRFLYILLGSGVLVTLLIIKTSFFPESSLSDYETSEIELRTIVCENCRETIKQALSNDAGIVSADVSLKTKTVSVKFDKTKTSREKIEDYIVKAGYDANDKIADINAYKELSECCKIWEEDNYMKHGEKESGGCTGGCCGN